MIPAASGPRHARGVVFVAYGDNKYRREAERAARSVRRHSPSLPCFLVSDAPFESDVFESTIVLDDFQREHIDKTLCIHAPCDRLLYLDSDTRVVAAVDEGFAVLDRFELAGVGVGTPARDASPGVPDTLPSINSGALFLRNDARMGAFLDLWRALCAQSAGDAGTLRDQPSLRRALWTADLDFVSLGAEWNLHIDKAMRLDGQVRVLHGRPDARLDEAERLANEWIGRRGFVPGIGCVPDYRFQSHRRLLGFAARVLGRWWRYVTTVGARRRFGRARGR